MPTLNKLIFFCCKFSFYILVLLCFINTDIEWLCLCIRLIWQNVLPSGDIFVTVNKHNILVYFLCYFSDNNIVSSSANIQKLYSPLFDVTEESCIEIAINTSYSGYYILVDVMDTNGLFVSASHRLYLNERGARTISLPLTTSDNQLQLVLGLDRGYSYYQFSVDYVLLSAGSCYGPGLFFLALLK